MPTLCPGAHTAGPLEHLLTARRGSEQCRALLCLWAPCSLPTALGLCPREDNKPTDCFQGFRAACDYVSSYASGCMQININTHLMTINTNIYIYVGMKTNKNSACKRASSAQGCYSNSLMKTENSNIFLSWLSPVALVLFKVWFSRLTGLVQCQRIHYLFSFQGFITCSSNPWPVSVFSEKTTSRSQGNRIAS